MKYIILIICAFVGFLNLKSQDLAAYTDYMGRFYIFDKGTSTKIEDQKPQSFKIGGNCVLYVSSDGHLGIYYNNKVEILEKNGISDYYTGDYLSSYSIYEKLNVISEGQVINLSRSCTNYYPADSVIAFYDKFSEAFKVFYKGEVYDLESGLLGNPIKQLSIGDNILAYISARTGDFNIWYRGSLIEVEENVPNTRFKAGRDIVAFNDVTEQNFKVFYSGEYYTLEDFPAQSFKTGDDFVAYINHIGEFRIFKDGKTSVISSFAPQDYSAEDNVLVFSQDNRFNAWTNGEVVEIEAFIPKYYKIDWNTTTYLDNSTRIWIYNSGEKKNLGNELVNSFETVRDLVMMNVKLNRNILYYNGKFYEGQSFYK
jgi:hypothetical protein